MRSSLHRLLFLCHLAWVASAADFVTDIHPILAARCLSCHAGPKAQAGLDLTTRENALRVLSPGNPAQSALLARVEGREGRLMPPVGKPLEPKQIEALRDWIAQGATWADTKQSAPSTWVAPLAPRAVALPSGSGNPVDRFLPAPPKGIATDAVFARRAYLDLWGISPSAQSLQSFVSSTDPQKRERLIENLLSEEKLYSGHWISWWNDLLRNDIGVVYHGERKAITPWLEAALRNNMPYDEMVRELLNPIGADSPEGFLIGVNWRGDVNASQTPYMQASQNTAQVFLGINLKCASCHDSFINKYKLKEAYGLAAMFSNEAKLEVVRCDNKTGVFQEPQFLWPELGTIPAGASPSERRYWAAKLFTSPQNGRLARTIVNRYWQKLMGKGLVEPVDDMDAKPSNPDLLDWLASDFAQHNYDLKYLLRLLMSSAAYQRADAQPRRMSAEQLVDTLSALTGEWRAVQSNNSDRAILGRDWQHKSSPLDRALGRPIRDQVYTTRNEEATTFQGLELSNGTTLAAMIHRGVMHLLGELPPSPDNLYDSRAVRGGELNVEVSIQGLKQVWLLTEDAGTFDPEKAVVGWKDITLRGKNGSKILQQGAVPAKIGSRMVFELEPGYDTLQAKVWVSDASKASDINASVRFFVFGAEPDRTRLVKVSGYSPWPAPPTLRTSDAAIDYFWRNLLGRAPSAAERSQAMQLFPQGKLQREGAEDLLWSLMMHPEFQFIW
ncbi:DUF1549 domain-containing protein [Bryobacter aggregatus]|uniref:DUF1549 domain-containing protein n=1 Tax=Bryobacter aggregatus TaxID=360054 RepID=UPI00068C15FB|nr:DUF1549 domain-containing protein [Bryobacter aggregatus]